MKKVYTMMLGAILVGGLFSGCVSNKQVVTLDKMSKQDPEVVQIHKMKIREDQFLTVSKRIFPNAKDTKGLIKTLGTYDGLPSLVDMAYVYSAGGSLLDGQRMREKSSFYSIDDRNRDRLKTLMNSDKRDEYIQILDQKLDTYLANSGVGQTKLRERFVDGYLYISGYKQEKTLEIEAFISSLGGAESQLQLKYTKAVDIYKTQSGGYYVVVAGSILSLPADHIATVDTALMLSLLGEKPENYYLPQEKDLELSVSQKNHTLALSYARNVSVWLNRKGYVGPRYTEKSLYYMRLSSIVDDNVVDDQIDLNLPYSFRDIPQRELSKERFVASLNQSRALNIIDVVYYKEEFDGDLDEIEGEDIPELQADGFVMQHLIHVLPFMPIEGKTMKTHVVLSKSASALYLESVVEIPALTKTQRKVLATDMSTIEVDILPDTQEEEFDEKEDTNSSQATQTKLFK